MIRINTFDLYDYYLENYEGDEYLTCSEFKKVILKYNKFMLDLVLDGEEVVFPAGMGSLYIGGKKSKVRYENGKVRGIPPNWHETFKLWKEDPKAKEEGKILFYLNEHTDGIRYKYIWNKRNVRVLNKTIYSLAMSRAAKKAAYNRIISGSRYRLRGNGDYREIHKFREDNNKDKEGP